MEVKLNEKEFYKNKITESIKNIDDIKMLIYLSAFITEKTKKRE